MAPSLSSISSSCYRIKEAMPMPMQMNWVPNHLLRRRKLGLPPLGLKNLGNSCYLNSVLQCLSYAPPLAHFCLNHAHSSLCPNAAATDPDADVCPLCLLERHVILSHTSLSQDSPLVPSKIRRYICLFARHFRLGRQEDAHEFLRLLIDACSTLKHKQRRYKEEQEEEEESSSVFQQIFGGSLLSQVKCLSCGAESNKLDDFMDISLDIFHSSSLNHSLQSFFHPELLDGSNKYRCESCSNLSSAKKQMFFLQAPNILVIQFKRFEGGMNGSKIDRPIAFQEILRLSSYMSKSSQDLQPVYKLFGCVVHSGYSPESGHYYAYVKDTAGCWYRCNDSLVSLSTLEEVLSEKAYVLFFSRANKSPIKNSIKELGSVSDGVVKTKGIVVSKQPVNVKCAPQICPGNIVSIENMFKLSSEPKEVFNDQTSAGSKNFACANEWRNVKDTDCRNVVPLETHEHLKKSSTAPNSLQNYKISTMGVQVQPCDDRNDIDKRKSFDDLLEVTKENTVSSKTQKLSMSGKCLKTRIAPNSESFYGVGTAAERDKRELVCSDEVKSSLTLNPKHVFSDDANFGSELENFQQRLANEASMTLRNNVWFGDVHNFMRGKKRSLAELLEDDAELKKSLIADARKIFLSQVPESLKGDLVQRLKSLSSIKVGCLDKMLKHR